MRHSTETALATSLFACMPLVSLRMSHAYFVQFEGSGQHLDTTGSQPESGSGSQPQSGSLPKPGSDVNADVQGTADSGNVKATRQDLGPTEVGEPKYAVSPGGKGTDPNAPGLPDVSAHHGDGSVGEAGFSNSS